MRFYINHYCCTWLRSPDTGIIKIIKTYLRISLVHIFVGVQPSDQKKSSSDFLLLHNIFSIVTRVIKFLFNKFKEKSTCKIN